MRYVNHARRCAGVLFLLGLVGCAGTPQVAALRQSTGVLPPKVELATVPFFPQETHQCGPAALATALNFAGVKTTPQSLTPQVYVPDRQGSLQVEMLATVRRQSLMAYPLAPSLRDLLLEVAAGRPVIVLQNLGLPVLPLWHYAVVVGYDLEREEIILRSGLERRQVLSFTSFEYTWARSDYWALLTLVPTRLPASATEARFVSAAVALERAGQIKPAQTAYQTALARWPQNLPARMGLGNTAYALGDLKGAEAAFRHASDDYPNEWPPLNNLAQTLADQKRYGEALTAVQLALALAGNNHPQVQETLKAIQAKAIRK